MTIRQAFIETLNNNFAFVRMQRNANALCEVLNAKVKNSNTMRMLPIIEKVELETIDDSHDKLSICYDDYTIEGIVTWKSSTNFENAFIFMNVE